MENSSQKISQIQYQKQRSKRFQLYIAYSILIPPTLYYSLYIFSPGSMVTDLISYALYGSILISIMMMMYWYLQIKPSSVELSYIPSESETDKYQRMLLQINEITDAIKLYKNNIKDDLLYADFIKIRLEALPQKPEFEKFNSKTLTEESRLSLFNLVLNNLHDDLREKFSKSLARQKAKPNEETTKEYSITRLIKLTDHITSRLKKEIEQLTKRGNIYISIGSIITIAGGIVLYATVKDFIQAYSAVSSINDTFNKHDIFSISARISIILFIEIFAYYYLKLYKNIMDNVKFYQNEISNMELKLLALHAIENSGNVDALKSLTDELAKTERNFVINKGQTTVDIEKARHENNVLYKSIDSISKLIKPSK